MAPVKVAFVSSHASLGGAERYLELLLGALGPDWVSGVVCLASGPFVDVLRGHGYPTAVLPTSPRAPGILRSSWGLRRLLAKTKPAVVHANGVKAALVAVLATRGSSVPVIWVKHDFSWDGPRARRLGQRCAQVVGVSRAVNETFHSDPSIERHVVHNGLAPVPIDRREGRRRLGEALAPDTPTAVVLPRRPVRPVQGPPGDARDRARPRRADPGLRFALLGDEVEPHLEYAQSLRREVEELGLGGFVRFLVTATTLPS